MSMDIKRMRIDIQRYERTYYSELRQLLDRYESINNHFPDYLKGPKAVRAIVASDGIIVIHSPAAEDSFEFSHTPRPAKYVTRQFSVKVSGYTFDAIPEPNPGLVVEVSQPSYQVGHGPNASTMRFEWDRAELVCQFDKKWWTEERARLKATNDILGCIAANLMGLPKAEPPLVQNKAEQDIYTYRQLILGDPHEEEVQRFLTEHPFLLSLSALRIVPKQPLGSDYITDFVIEQPAHHWVMVEIERPEYKLFTKAGNPTSQLTHAQRQVENWRDWVAENLPYARKSLPNILEPEGWVVLGRRTDMTELEQTYLQRKNRELTNIRILTFDDLADIAERGFRNLFSFTR